MGSAVRKLTLAADGTLFADVWNYQPNLDLNADMTYSLYVWDAPKLIQGALNAYNDKEDKDDKDEIAGDYPIDRDKPRDPRVSAAAKQIPELTPERYDDPGNGKTFKGWMNLGSYQEPGSYPAFGKVDVRPAAMVVVPKEAPIPFTAGLEGEFAPLGYILGGINLLTGGYMERADQRQYKYHTGQMTHNEMVHGNIIDFVATTGAFVVSGTVAAGLTVKLTSTGWRAIVSAGAQRGAAEEMVFNAIEQARANVIYLRSDGKDGELGVSLSQLAVSTAFGAGLGAALARLGIAVEESCGFHVIVTGHFTKA